MKPTNTIHSIHQHHQFYGRDNRYKGTVRSIREENTPEVPVKERSSASDVEHAKAAYCAKMRATRI